MKKVKITLILFTIFSAYLLGQKSTITNKRNSDCCAQYDNSNLTETLINTFYPVAFNFTAPQGSKEILLDAVPITDFFGNSFGTTPIRKGDLLLVIQMQGAEFDSRNQREYGDGTGTSGPDNQGGTGFTFIGQTGLFEYVIALNDVQLSGGLLMIRSSCEDGGLQNTYVNGKENPNGLFERFQVVRVPQFKSLKLQKDITSTAWNGRVGSIISLNVLDTLDLNGFKINADGKGFRGGFVPLRESGGSNSIYATLNLNLSSGKGEGICGTPRYLWNGINSLDNGISWNGYKNGNYGTGAPGNAGGGGNAHNAGGGGGGNGGSGGLGGRAWCCAGNTEGTSGRPGSKNPVSEKRVFAGGGGGGGDVNSTADGNKGGSGGGIVLIHSKSIIGNGSIHANGLDGRTAAQDGGSGGGAGGTIFIYSGQNPQNPKFIISATGGIGGNAYDEGPGGGGSGGSFLTNIDTVSIKINLDGGKGGIWNSNGSNNGATKGDKGIFIKINQSGIMNNSFYPYPFSNFEYSLGCTGEPVIFLNLSTVNEAYDSKIMSYKWNFGDGSFNNEKSPSHIYGEPGEYLVTLIVTTNFSCSDTLSQWVKINPIQSKTENVMTCSTYFWNGNSYNKSGTYIFKTKNLNGCDSIAILELIIESISVSTAELTACDQYIWNGKTYTQGGTFTYATTNVKGCDSIATLQLTVNKSSTSTQSATACDQYLWNGKTYTQGGIYTYITTNVKGCDSIATLQLTVNKSTASNQSFTACDQYNWNGKTYMQGGTYTYATTNTKGCDSITILQLTVNKSSNSTQNITSCDQYTWNGKTYTQGGTYTYATINVKGCDSIATLQLTVNKSSNSTQSAIDCDQYIWNNETYTQSGNYTFKTNNAKGCDSIATLRLTINRSSTSFESISYCDRYKWNGTTYSESGIYTYQTPNFAGCDSTATLQLDIKSNSLFLPNIFSPNGDASNDCFGLRYFKDDLTEFIFKVYDRWGNMLFTTNEPDQCWDGTFKGVSCNEGIYVYYVQVNGLYCGLKQVTGSVTLIR